MTPPAPFRVLHVCTGNLCRSPMAELLLRAGLQARDVTGVEVTSAGTHGLTGCPADPDALLALQARGVDGSAFRARELAAPDVQQADLILAATREHRAAAVVLDPGAAARTFTLLEFARLAAEVDPTALPTGPAADRALALVALVRAQRGRVRPARPGDDDLPDPYRGPRAGFERCAASIEAALRGPLDLLAGT